MCAYVRERVCARVCKECVCVRERENCVSERLCVWVGI